MLYREVMAVSGYLIQPGFYLLVLIGGILLPMKWVVAAPLSCSKEKIVQLCTTATAADAFIEIDCHIDFTQMDCRRAAQLPNVITKQLRFQGSSASGVIADFNQAHIDAGAGTLHFQRGDIIEIRSIRDSGGHWLRPERVQLLRARITGSLRIFGMGRNGEDPLVRASSLDLNHTDRVRLAAPTQINIESMHITGTGRNPVYFGPGVTNSILQRSTIDGSSARVGIYLDAESHGNTIQDNRISVNTVDGSVWGFYDRGWPQIAIDASSHNRVIGNHFSHLRQGGIYLYRNCGEGGTVRHSTSSDNVIEGNIFEYDDFAGLAPAVFIGSRDYGRWENWLPGSHCDDDEQNGITVGSARSNADHATDNSVILNRIKNHWITPRNGGNRRAMVSDRIQLRNPAINTGNEIRHNRMVD